MRHLCDRLPGRRRARGGHPRLGAAYGPEAGRARQLLAEIGLEPERLEMFNLSSADGPRFAEIVKTMVERVKRLGRNPLRPDPQRVLENVQEMSRQAEAMLAGERQ
jgi:hypothetical protein